MRGRMLHTLADKALSLYSYTLQLLNAPLRLVIRGRSFYSAFEEFIEQTKLVSSPRILELGSRNVTGVTRRSLFPHAAEYVGVDIHPGEGVDVVCDVHQLSRTFPQNHFDFVYSVVVFEHLLFPWKAAMEINTVLKMGGQTLVVTHPVWPAHELPWDFWRFPANGFHALFNKVTGFEIESVIEGAPCKLYSLGPDKVAKGNCLYVLNQSVTVRAKKVADYRRDLIKWDVSVSDVLDSMYPKPGT